MKIVLSAFQNKLKGLMEVPEDTGVRFKLAMTQPIVLANFGHGKQPILDSPIDTICEFEWTGGTFYQKDHPYDGARDYQLVRITT